MDKRRYIADGKVKRSTIATDIVCRQLTGIDIEHIANDPTVKKTFFGKLEPLKRPKSQWDSVYVNYLHTAVTTECFNREYLLYLDQVAGYVSKAKFRKKLVTVAIIIALAIAVGGIVYAFTHGSQKQDAGAQDMASIIEAEHTDEEPIDTAKETLNI